MNSSIPLSRQDLEDHLNEQIGFLKASCIAFDGGFDAEAKRLALTLRVLLHDTKSSRSLLGQLGMKDKKFLSTCLPEVQASQLAHGGLVFVHLTPAGACFRANLDNVPTMSWIDFDKWWKEFVFKDNKSARLSRKDLVLTAANQDGGGHVDPSLDATYHRLTRQNSMDMWDDQGQGKLLPMENPAKAAIRQITHEVIRSIDDSFRQMPNIQDTSLMIGGASLVFGDPPEELFKRPPGKSLGRNDRCFCGSGKKFKRCHGRNV